MNGFRFNLCQRPVGQGGFHVGSLAACKDDDSHFHISCPPDFRWAYDCGSNQIDVLNREIDNFQGSEFDVLFLSHLDSDHVCGVDKLTGNTQVKEVVLPYLSDDDWALHLAAEISNGTFSGTFADLVADPSGWFGSRGVERLTYIEAESDDNNEEPILEPVDQPNEHRERVSDGHPKIIWSRSRLKSSTSQAAPDKAQVSIVSKGGVGSVSISGQILTWVLSPFAYRPSDIKMQQFRVALENAFGKYLSAKEYAEKARTDSGRKLLRKCYDDIWEDHNLHSMALYTGPRDENYRNIQSTAWYGRFIHRIVAPGWVSTGDFDSAVMCRRNKLLKHYSLYANMVGHMTLPHHGSDASFDAALLTAFPNLFAAVAAVGPNTYGHPGCTVMAEIARMPTVNFVRVDQNQSSRYSVDGYISQ